MKSALKGLLISIIVIVGIIVFFSYAFSGNKKAELEKKTLWEKHCNLIWSDLNTDEKKQVIEEFINEYNGLIPPDDYKGLGYFALRALNDAVKYSNTITIDGDKVDNYISLSKYNAKIKDIETGEVNYILNFMSKNKLNMDVRSQLVMKVKYQAGCKKFEVIDISIN